MLPSEETHMSSLTRLRFCMGFVAAVAAMVLPTTEANAAGRTGSKRSGGRNSAGKGSRYVGGSKKKK